MKSWWRLVLCEVVLGKLVGQADRLWQLVLKIVRCYLGELLVSWCYTGWWHLSVWC